MNPRDNDRLDQWLDSALQQYRSAEPRAGLEGRILANMAAEKQPFALRLRWGFAVATAAVICGTVVFWFETSSHAPHTNKAVAVQAPIEHRNTSHLSQQTPEHVAGKLRMKNVTARPRSAQAQTLTRHGYAGASARRGALDQRLRRLRVDGGSRTVATTGY